MLCRPEPLRPTLAGSTPGLPHPERTCVDLAPFTLPSDPTSTAYLLDHATGLLYYAPTDEFSGLQEPADSQQQQQQLWQQQQQQLWQQQQQQPQQLWQRRQPLAPDHRQQRGGRPYPELAGRVQRGPEGALLPARPPDHVHRVFQVSAFMQGSSG